MLFFISLGCCLVLAVVFKLCGIFKRKYLEPLFLWLGVFGIVALCQPFFFGLYQVGYAILLTGMVGFNVASRIK